MDSDRIGGYLPPYLNMPVHAVVSWDLVLLYQVAAADTVLATVYQDLFSDILVDTCLCANCTVKAMDGWFGAGGCEWTSDSAGCDRAGVGVWSAH